MSQIFSTIVKAITIPEIYKNFEDVISTKNAGHLPVLEYHDYAIDLLDDKQPPYGPLKSLSKNELSIVWAYIDKNLANIFIRQSKFPAGATIFSVLKLNRGLRLYVEYRGLNNLIIHNR